MSFLHQKSCECVKTELDLFSLPPTQTSIESGKWIQYKPVSSLTDDAPIEFVVPGHGDEYTDLSQTLLNVTASIVKADGTKLTAEESKLVGPTENWLYSLFNQVDVYMNHKLVTPQNNTYAYRAYIENLLNYGFDAKNSHLSAVMFYEETSGKMEDLTDANKGLGQRRTHTALSKECEMVGHLHVDVCNQDKYMLNGVELRFRFLRSRDAFSLMYNGNAGDYKVSINEANLFVRRCKINPSVLLAHSRTLETGTAKYPITRVEVKTITLPTGIQSKTLDSVFLGQLPKRVIIGMVTNKAFNGNPKSNPFNFQHFNMNYFTLYVDGEQVPYSKPFQPTVSDDKEKYVMAYHSMFTGTGIQSSDSGNNIIRDSYPHGFWLMAFDLTPDMSASDTGHWNLVRNGNLRIELGFEQALAESVNVIVYAELDNVIEVDRDRNVSVDFGS